jgi:hypothetical protein
VNVSIENQGRASARLLLRHPEIFTPDRDLEAREILELHFDINQAQ